jgi:hypothetical protein
LYALGAVSVILYRIKYVLFLNKEFISDPLLISLCDKLKKTDNPGKCIFFSCSSLSILSVAGILLFTLLKKKKKTKLPT